MDSAELANIPSVRLASGVEIQQRWPGNYQHQSAQKNDLPPHLIEMTPCKGAEGTVLNIVVQSLPDPTIPVKLAFNSLMVNTKQMEAQGITSLAATVPPFQKTLSSTANVPISICLIDKDCVVESWAVAEFFYEFTGTKESTTSTPTTAPSASNNSSIDYDPNDKKSNSFQSRGDATPSTYGNFYQQPVSNYGNMPQYSYTLNRDVYDDNKYNSYRQRDQSRTTNTQMSPTSYNNNTSSINLFNPTTTGFAGMLSGFDQNNPNNPQALPADMPQQLSPLGYPQQHRQSAPAAVSGYGYSKSTVHVPSTSVANYQPYPGLVSRANLRITGELDSMTKSWTPEEWEHGRRLVQFWRKQDGNEISCTFDIVPPGERVNNRSDRIVVSCIYWPVRNDFFITSVDCIHLLESLMDIRFSVEEKNRVRRNLEGFRPSTVSKCKAESADFFKLIMGFPNPKPRNIEKDVKVFPWKTLPYALKKIVTKYTASSYHGKEQQRGGSQLKSPVSTPPSTTTNPACMNQPTAYQTDIYHQQPQQSLDSYSPPSQQQQRSEECDMYPSTPSAFSSYNQPVTTSPPSGEKQRTSSSPTRMNYPYGDMITPTTSTSTITSQQSPSLNQRGTPDSQQNYLV